MGSEGAVSPTPVRLFKSIIVCSVSATFITIDAAVVARLAQGNARRRRPSFDEAPEEELWA